MADKVLDGFEQIVTLGDYATRKGLNRSDKKIPTEVLEEIENKGVSLERLNELANDVPIYLYKTQITLHGNWDELSGSGRTGGYKNLIRNDNGSLGIKYSAIDYPKFERLAIGLKAIDKKIGVSVNSTNRMFILKTERFKDKLECIEKYKNDFTPYYNSVKSEIEKLGVDVLISVKVGAYVDWFGFFAAISVTFMACPESKMNAVFEALAMHYKPLNASLEHYVSEYEKEALIEKERRKLEADNREAERLRVQKANMEIALTFKPLAKEITEYILTKGKRVSQMNIGKFWVITPLTSKGLYLLKYEITKGSFGKLKFTFGVIHINNIELSLADVKDLMAKPLNMTEGQKQKAAIDFTWTDAVNFELSKCIITQL
jgi:hypothetical protein